MEGFSEQHIAMLATAIALVIKIYETLMLISLCVASYYDSSPKNRKRKRSTASNYERHPIRRLDFMWTVFASDLTGLAREALNEIQVEGAGERLNAEDLDNIAKSKFFIESLNGNSGTFNYAAIRNQLLRETSIPQRRVRTRKSQGDLFFSTIEKLGERCQDLSVELGKLVKRFQFMVDDASKKRNVFGVISKIEGLTLEEVVKVGAIITSDTAKTNYLFSIPYHSKKLYARMLLGGSQ